MAYTETESKAKPAQTDEDKLRLALERFRLSAEADEKQREREVEDLRFVDFDDQWPAEIRKARGAVEAYGNFPAMPGRPCLTINKLRHPVQQVTNQARQAKLALSFAPKGDDASVDIAEAYEDIVRAIQANTRAHLARQWAFERAAKCGRGYYRILTGYVDGSDEDLEIIYKRILNQSSVYLDPFAMEPDWSDGEWAFVTEDVPHSRFKRQFPKSKLSDLDSSDLTAVGDEPDCKEWVKFGEDGKPTIRVAEYFYKDDGKVHWCKLTASEILDSEDWPGKFIPIVPVIGIESNVNGERRWVGVVRPAMQSQVAYNVMRSAQVEAIGLAPKAPFIAYAEVLEGYEDWWSQANVRNFPFLPIKAAKDASGHALPPPMRQIAETPIQAITVAVTEADQDIKATTAIFDPSLGNVNPSERSGKAILALQKQAETGTASYLDNLSSMSMVYEGKVVKDLIKNLYNRPGRIVAAIGADDQRRQLLLGVPSMPGQKGQPQQVPEGTQGSKVIDLAKGEYTVEVKVGKSFTTRREEGAAAMGEIINAVPQLMGVVGDLYVDNLDFPGARQMADRIKKTLPPNLQDDQGQQQIPPQVQQQMQQAQQVIDLLTKELSEKTKLIETDAIKSSADLERERLKHQTDIETTRMQEETKLRIAAMQAELKQLEHQVNAEQADRDRQAKAQEGERSRQHETSEGERTRAHERSSGIFEAGVEAIQQDATRAHSMVEGEVGREHERQMSEQQMGHEQQMAEQQAQQAPE